MNYIHIVHVHVLQDSDADSDVIYGGRRAVRRGNASKYVSSCIIMYTYSICMYMYMHSIDVDVHVHVLYSCIYMYIDVYCIAGNIDRDFNLVD